MKGGRKGKGREEGEGREGGKEGRKEWTQRGSVGGEDNRGIEDGERPREESRKDDRDAMRSQLNYVAVLTV